jgi:hypothetical protein
MRAARITSVIISSVFIVLVTMIGLLALSASQAPGETLVNSVIGYLTIDLFFVALLYIPHRLKEHPRYPLANWIVFGINILSVLALIAVLYVMSQIEC